MISPLKIALGALLAFVTAALIWVVAVHTTLGLDWDSNAIGGFTGFDHPRVKHGADFFAHLADPIPFGLMTATVALIALVQRRWWLAILVPAAMLGANFTTQLLKDVLASQRFSEWLGVLQIPASAWPSGHSTAAMTLALGLTLVVPAALRPVAAIFGAAFAIGVGFSVTLLGWHYPSDVLGGFLVATGWMLIALAIYVAVLQCHGSLTRVKRGSILTHPVFSALLAVFVGVGFAAIAVRPEAVRFYAGTQTSFVVAALAIAVLGASSVVGIAALRDRVA